MDTNTVTATELELTAADRCDSCSAAAQVRASFLTGMLLFCGHHARKNKDGLARQALSVYDPDGSLDL
jgi:hypothetical protein